MVGVRDIQKKIFPVGLLLSGRRCVVVGGGKIALRKTGALLAAEAAITVVSPVLHSELSALLEQHKIKHVAREFEPGDVADAFLVFAATDDTHVNRQILRCCHEQGVYGCSVDKSWVDGDFVTPATFRKGDLTVSVSTGGKSCRRSKLIKNSLSRHVEMVESAGLIIMGTSHNYLSIAEREPFHVTGRRRNEAAEMVMQVWGVHEFAILNTCNRIELVAVVTQSPLVERVLKCILGFDHLKEDRFYIKRDADAFAHLSVMTAGLLSQTPGENHIVAQVKDAVGTAVRNGWASGMLEQWLSSTLHISKDIRRETSMLLHNHEIEDLTVQYISSEVTDWRSKQVMVLGTGVVGACLVKRLLSNGIAVTWCYHHNKPDITPDTAEGISLCSMNALREKISGMDVIVCATSSEGHLIHMGHAPFFDQERNTVVVDLAMPRNVAPELNGIADSIRVIDLDDLKHWYRREKADMTRIFDVSRNVTDEHREMYEKLIESFQGRNPQQ